MTNAQKWILVFLSIFVVLSIITWITYDDETNIPDNYTQSEANSNNKVNDEGLALANKIGCTNCHGFDLKGSGIAPLWYRLKIIGTVMI